MTDPTMLMLLRRCSTILHSAHSQVSGTVDTWEKEPGATRCLPVRSSHKRKFLNQLLVFRGNTAVL